MHMHMIPFVQYETSATDCNNLSCLSKHCSLIYAFHILVTSPTPLIQHHLLRTLLLYSDASMLSSDKQVLTKDCMPASRRPVTDLKRLVQPMWRTYGQLYHLCDVFSGPRISCGCQPA